MWETIRRSPYQMSASDFIGEPHHPPMILIKLGGSVITDKSQYRTFSRETVSRLCREIADSGRDCIVVHGAGSYGHIMAKRFSLQDGYSGKEQIPAVAKVQQDVRELSSMVIGELISAGIPAVSVPPGSCFVMDGGKLVADNDEAIRALKEMGIMPVMFGDVVMDRKKGFGICSGDQLMEVLARIFDPEMSIFVSDIDGLYLSDPKKDPGAEFVPEVTREILERISSEQSSDDVTGGVAGKMGSMLSMCAEKRACILLNGTVPGRLESALRGKNVRCTTARV